ncbi:hypothetical protein D3C87_1996420 [compost metagenome]
MPDAALIDKLRFRNRNALHVVAVDPVRAERNAVWFGPCFEDILLGLDQYTLHPAGFADI